MPSFEKYKDYLGANSNGLLRKNISDLYMEQTWYQDIQSRIAYIYDQDHDDQFEYDFDIPSEKSVTKIPVEIKLIQGSYNSINKEEQTMHVMFKPSYNFENITYYHDAFSKYGLCQVPMGMFIDIPDEKGKYRRWIIVDEYSLYSTQFPSWEVLPCDYNMKWIYKSKKYSTWCTSRVMKSYKSGVFVEKHIEHLVNQKVIAYEINKYTETLFYNQRVCLNAFVTEREPIIYRCTKIEDSIPFGILTINWNQDVFDKQNDYIEKDEEGNIVAIWCDYFNTATPTDEPPKIETRYVVISYNGTKPELKVKGSIKKLTATFYDENNNQIDFNEGVWSFTINDNDVSDLLEITTNDDDITLLDNQIKIKFIGNSTYIGKSLIIKFTSLDNSASGILEFNIVGL